MAVREAKESEMVNTLRGEVGGEFIMSDREGITYSFLQFEQSV